MSRSVTSFPTQKPTTRSLPEVRGMGKNELKILRKWIAAGRRERSRTERVYGRIRRLGAADRQRMADKSLPSSATKQSSPAMHFRVKR